MNPKSQQTLGLSGFSLILIFRDFIHQELGLDPISTVFSRVHLPGKNWLQQQLPENVRGRVIYLIAQNQYVEVVTENGSYLIRTSLKNAVSYTNKGDGMLVHRSRWMAFSEMTDFVYRNGTPYVIDQHDQLSPVDRKTAVNVKRAIGNILSA